jgi:hypothetical protein
VASAASASFFVAKPAFRSCRRFPVRPSRPRSATYCQLPCRSLQPDPGGHDPHQGAATAALRGGRHTRCSDRRRQAVRGRKQKDVQPESRASGCATWRRVAPCVVRWPPFARSPWSPCSGRCGGVLIPHGQIRHPRPMGYRTARSRQHTSSLRLGLSPPTDTHRVAHDVDHAFGVRTHIWGYSGRAFQPSWLTLATRARQDRNFGQVEGSPRLARLRYTVRPPMGHRSHLVHMIRVDRTPDIRMSRHCGP